MYNPKTQATRHRKKRQAKKNPQKNKKMSNTDPTIKHI